METMLDIRSRRKYQYAYFSLFYDKQLINKISNWLVVKFKAADSLLLHPLYAPEPVPQQIAIMAFIPKSAFKNSVTDIVLPKEVSNVELGEGEEEPDKDQYRAVWQLIREEDAPGYKPPEVPMDVDAVLDEDE